MRFLLSGWRTTLPSWCEARDKHHSTDQPVQDSSSSALFSLPVSWGWTVCGTSNANGNSRVHEWLNGNHAFESADGLESREGERDGREGCFTPEPAAKDISWQSSQPCKQIHMNWKHTHTQKHTELHEKLKEEIIFFEVLKAEFLPLSLTRRWRMRWPPVSELLFTHAWRWCLHNMTMKDYSPVKHAWHCFFSSHIIKKRGYINREKER